MPQGDRQFGGFRAGSSRNGNATSYNGRYNYLKDRSTGAAITGWRLFDIKSDGTVQLISAGNTEDYFYTSNGQVSANLLTNQRNWSMYARGTKGQSATVLTKSMLDSWYSKYIQPGADTRNSSTFQKIYQAPYIRYQTIVDNNSYYWFASSNSSNYLDIFYPNSRVLSSDYDGSWFSIRFACCCNIKIRC